MVCHKRWPGGAGGPTLNTPSVARLSVNGLQHLRCAIWSSHITVSTLSALSLSLCLFCACPTDDALQNSVRTRQLLRQTALNVSWRCSAFQLPAYSAHCRRHDDTTHTIYLLNNNWSNLHQIRLHWLLPCSISYLYATTLMMLCAFAEANVVIIENLCTMHSDTI